MCTKMIKSPVPFFFLKIALAVRGFLYFHTCLLSCITLYSLSASWSFYASLVSCFYHMKCRLQLKSLMDHWELLRWTFPFALLILLFPSEAGRQHQRVNVVSASHRVAAVRGEGRGADLRDVSAVDWVRGWGEVKFTEGREQSHRTQPAEGPCV